jgi:putative transposase
MSDDLVDLIVRPGRENRRWGCVRIQGELRKIGIRVSTTSIRRILRRAGLGLRPGGWTHLGRVPALPGPRSAGHGVHHRGHRGLKQLYVLFVIELSTHQVHIRGVTDHPTGAFVTQPARNLMGDLLENGRSTKFLIRDQDTTSPPASTRWWHPSD